MTTAQEKFAHDEAEKLKSYKVSFDPERVHHLTAAAAIAREYQSLTALSGAITRELVGINAKQAEIDAKELEEHTKKLTDAKVSDAPKEEDAESPPTRASARSR